MRKHLWLTALVAILLAATLSWADFGFAQGRGQGRGAAVQGQGAGKGRGTGNPATCPYYSSAQTCPRYGTGNYQVRKRQRLRQTAPQSQANTQPSQTQTPSNQNGN